MRKVCVAKSLLEAHQSADEEDSFSFRGFSWMFWNFVVDGAGDEIEKKGKGCSREATP